MPLTNCPVGRAFNVTTPGESCPPAVKCTDRPELCPPSCQPSPCATMIQPYHGTLTDGVSSHLQTVHGMDPDDAMHEATEWVHGE